MHTVLPRKFSHDINIELSKANSGWRFLKNSSHTSSISDVDVSFLVEERRGKGRDGEEEDYSRVDSSWNANICYRQSGFFSSHFGQNINKCHLKHKNEYYRPNCIKDFSPVFFADLRKKDRHFLLPKFFFFFQIQHTVLTTD